MKKIFCLFVLLFLIGAPQASADDYFDIEDYQVKAVIQSSSLVEIQESIDVNFKEERHGIFRDIPTDGISLKLKSITDKAGNAWNYETIGFDQGVRYKIGDADILVSGPQTYQLDYAVRGAIRFFPGFDEFYWNVTGNDWPADIKQASIQITLPESLKGRAPLKIECYTGYFGALEKACRSQFNRTKGVVTVSIVEPLYAYEGLTVLIDLPPSITPPASLEVKTTPDRADAILRAQETQVCQTDCRFDAIPAGSYVLEIQKFGYKHPDPKPLKLQGGDSRLEQFDLEPFWWFLIGAFLVKMLAGLIALEPIYRFIRYGRDPKGRGLIIAEYDSPDDLIPAEMGTLVDESADTQDISSTIIDLAVRGYLKIKAIPDTTSWFLKQDDYELIKEENLKPGDRGLTAFESSVMEAVFENASIKKISDLEYKFYKHLEDLRQSLYGSLIDKGYFEKSPQSVRIKYIIKGIVMIFAGFFLINLELISFGSAWSVVFPVNGILTLVFAYFMPRKTASGVRAFEHALGFKLYLETAEKNRIKFQEKENLFYAFLPFAMTLGIAEKWSHAFEGAFQNPPKWYVGYGSGPFNPISFSRHMSHVSSSMNSAFRSTPSSHSSGGGGGGFSGGGFGGGGGGSW